MAGYADTKKLIEDTLVGRPAGSLIYPDGHQAMAMSLLDYIHSVELLGASELQGIATTSTVPVQPDNAKVSYIATVPAGQTYVFTNFHDQNGNSISVTTGANTVSLLTFLWNGEYWQVQNNQIQLMLNITAGYLYSGIAIPTTDPGSPDQPVFYIAVQAGTYDDFGGIVVNDGEAAILKYVNSSWVKEVSGLATRKEVSRLDQDIHRTMSKDSQVIEERNLFWGENTTINGVQFTFTENGLTIVGTPSAAILLPLRGATSVENSLFSAGQYTAKMSGDLSNSISLRYAATSDNPGTRWVNNTTPQDTVTFAAETTVVLSIVTGQTYNNTIKIQIDKGSTVGDWIYPPLSAVDVVARMVNGKQVDNPEYLFVIIDSDDRILTAIRKDGSVEWPVGVPAPVREYVNQKIADASPVKIRIMDNNVGHWGFGGSWPLSPSHVARAISRMINYKKLYMDIQPDFIGLQNYNQTLDEQGDYDVDNILYDFILPYHFNRNDDKANKTRYPILRSEYKAYTPVTGTKWCGTIISVVEIQGRTVYFANTNLPYQNDDMDAYISRRELVGKMIADAASYDYAFIMGDFNTYGVPSESITPEQEGRELEAYIENLGWIGLNHNYLGPVQTAMRTTGVGNALDNIIFKANGKTVFRGFQALSNDRDMSFKWRKIAYDNTLSEYSSQNTYNSGDKVNMFGDFDFSYQCEENGVHEAPYEHYLLSDHYPIIGDFILY